MAINGAPGSPTVGFAPRPSQSKGFLRSMILFCITLFFFRLIVLHYGILFGLVFLIGASRMGGLRLVSMIFSLILASQSPTGAYREALRRADTMAAPITEKESSSGASDRLKYGVSCMQGWRRAMEDAHITMLIEGKTTVGDHQVTLPPGGFFSVFDGHCGSTIAQFCGSNLFSFIVATPAFLQKDYGGAMVQGYVAIDKHLQANEMFRKDRSGCTAISVWIMGNELYCANAGDSRAILSRSGSAFPLSTDHKPNNPEEQRRIEKAGGMVRNKRVNGVLALSRALGDFSFKQNWMIGWEEQAVTPVPDIVHVTLGARDEFVVIACDGIWDVMTNTQVVQFVAPRIAKGVPLSQICELLMQNCLSPHPFGLGCDNMSVILVALDGTGTVSVGRAGSSSDVSKNGSA